MTYQTFLESLLKDAGSLAMTFPPRMASRIKNTDANQVVTAADMAIGSQIKSRIQEKFPHDSVIDEESGAVRGTSPITWIIDPIDGTSNFAVGSPLFGVMVGVLEHGKPVAAWRGSTCPFRNIHRRGQPRGLPQWQQTGDRPGRRPETPIDRLRYGYPSG